MRNSINLLVSAVGAVALFSSLSVSAGLLSFGPDDEEAKTSDLNRDLKLEDIRTIFGTSADLDLLYKANFNGDEEGPYKPFYSTDFSSDPDLKGNPNNAVITWDGDGLDYIVCPECYLVVKDGEEPQYLFDLGDWDGQSTLELMGFYPDKGAISNVAIWGKSVPVEVPEPGTLGLLGLGILGLVSVKRRTQKSA